MWGLENTAKRNKTLHNAKNDFIHGAQNAKNVLFMVQLVNICFEIYCLNYKLL